MTNSNLTVEELAYTCLLLEKIYTNKRFLYNTEIETAYNSVFTLGVELAGGITKFYMEISRVKERESE